MPSIELSHFFREGPRKEIKIANAAKILNNQEVMRFAKNPSWGEKTIEVTGLTVDNENIKSNIIFNLAENAGTINLVNLDRDDFCVYFSYTAHSLNGNYIIKRETTVNRYRPYQGQGLGYSLALLGDYTLQGIARLYPGNDEIYATSKDTSKGGWTTSLLEKIGYKNNDEQNRGLYLPKGTLVKKLR